MPFMTLWDYILPVLPIDPFNFVQKQEDYRSSFAMQIPIGVFWKIINTFIKIKNINQETKK